MAAVIVRIPDFPPLNAQGKPPRPMVVLVGREGWQAEVARELARSCAAIVCTDRVPRISPPEYLEALLVYFDAADIIVSWCGDGDDALYLDHWTFVGYAAGRWPEKMLCGVKADSTHPMAPGLSYLMVRRHLPVPLTLDQLIGQARNMAQLARSGQ